MVNCKYLIVTSIIIPLPPFPTKLWYKSTVHFQTVHLWKKKKNSAWWGGARSKVLSLIFNKLLIWTQILNFILYTDFLNYKIVFQIKISFVRTTYCLLGSSCEKIWQYLPQKVMSMHGHYIQKELCLRFPLQVITYLNKKKDR